MACRDVSFFNMSIPTEPTKFRVSTKYFTQEDLDLFVESMETLSRLERIRAERKKRQSQQQQQQQHRKNISIQRNSHSESISYHYAICNFDEVAVARAPLTTNDDNYFKGSYDEQEEVEGNYYEINSDSDECYVSPGSSPLTSSPNSSTIELDSFSSDNISTGSSISFITSSITSLESIDSLNFNATEVPLLNNVTKRRSKITVRAIYENDNFQYGRNERLQKKLKANIWNGLTTLRRKSPKIYQFHEIQEVKEGKGFLYKAMRYLNI